MDTIIDIARRHGLMVIEDAAQGIMSAYNGHPLGSMGDLGTFSFHETKNVTSGEGGALLINNDTLIERAEIIREKGTNRSQFSRGQLDRYTWVDIGSSYLPGEITAAFLQAQLEKAETITTRRKELWKAYHEAFELLERTGRLRRPIIPENCDHNGHLYYLLLKDQEDRNSFLKQMKQHGVNCPFHYVPLHSSPAGLKYGRSHGELTLTEDLADRLVRLPLWAEIPDDEKQYIINTVKNVLR
jgi:dTDP-4-amino-4,6-dideoxygalactose transaminase